jgi:SHS2 domain-containing protein
MNYEVIDNITSADIAVRVKAPSLSLLFEYGAKALMSEMVEDISSVKSKITKEGVLEGDDVSLLYFEFLNEFLFFKDAENLLLLPAGVKVLNTGSLYSCSYILKGETIDKKIHNFKVDIKAVTLHGMRIFEDEGVYTAESVFDV